MEEMNSVGAAAKIQKCHMPIEEKILLHSRTARDRHEQSQNG